MKNPRIRDMFGWSGRTLRSTGGEKEKEGQERGESGCAANPRSRRSARVVSAMYQVSREKQQTLTRVSSANGHGLECDPNRGSSLSQSGRKRLRREQQEGGAGSGRSRENGGNVANRTAREDIGVPREQESGWRQSSSRKSG